MASTTVRRSITASDPRSPLQLSTLKTSFPQQQIITSFQNLQASPFQFSPTTQFPRPAAQSPIIARATQSPIVPRATQSFPETPYKASETPIMPARRRRSSSLAKFLGPRNVPGLCACGQGPKSAKHQIHDCPRFESERERLVSKSPIGCSPVSPSPRPRHSAPPQSPTELAASRRKLVHVARKWRMRTLLSKYQLAVQTQQQSLEEKKAKKSCEQMVEEK